MFEGLRFLLRIAPRIPRLAGYRPSAKTSFADLLEARCEEFADRTFIQFEDRRITYAEFGAATNRVAHWGHELGLRRGDVVALLMENRPEYLVTWMGLSKLGVVSALINTNLSGGNLRHALATSEARHLVLGAECADRYATTSDDLERCLEVFVDSEPDVDVGDDARAWGPDLREALADRPTGNPPATWREGIQLGDDLLYIYTSGTTGPPKAARFSHLRYLGAGDMGSWAQDLDADCVHYGVLPLYHSAGGVMQTGATLFAGATLALTRRFSASRFWDDVRKVGATHFQYIGELCRYLLAQPERPNDRDHGLRLAVGNGLRPDIWETFQQRFGIDRILEFYAATEGNAGFMNFENKVGSVGRFPSRFLGKLLTTSELVRYDVENDTHPRDARGFCIRCGPDEPGELIGRIPEKKDSATGRFEGYTSEEATERKILRDVFEQGDAWFRSGDLLRFDDEGFYYFVDRIGDTFRWKGENVSTQEVAETLAEHPALDLVNVYGVAVPGADGRAGMLSFVPVAGRELDGTGFYAFVDERLPAYAAPVFVRALHDADVTGTFKLRKVSLQKEGWDPATITDPLWIRDDATRAYVPLTPEMAAALREGTRRV